MLQPKQWESDFFNKRIAQLSSLSNVRESDLGQYDIVEFVTDSLTLASSQRLTNLGFSLWESTIDFELALKDQVQECPTIVEYDTDKHGDISSLVDGLFHESRFHLPPFNHIAGNKFYKEWLNNACNHSFDDGCYIAQSDEKPVGFITLKFNPEIKHSRIGIIGLSAAHQNKGLGAQLFNKAINESLDRDITHLSVKTQLSNYNSIKFYFSRLATIHKLEHRFIFMA